VEFKIHKSMKKKKGESSEGSPIVLRKFSGAVCIYTKCFIKIYFISGNFRRCFVRHLPLNNLWAFSMSSEINKKK
jgi:hypothetical protein